MSKLYPGTQKAGIVLLSAKERLSILRRAYGMWAKRKPDPLRESRRIRKSLDRL